MKKIKKRRAVFTYCGVYSKTFYKTLFVHIRVKVKHSALMYAFYELKKTRDGLCIMLSNKVWFSDG